MGVTPRLHCRDPGGQSSIHPKRLSIMASAENTAGDSGAPRTSKWSTENRAALIGVAAALLGSLVGGLVTWGVTREQIDSQRQDARRAERLAAYKTFAADAYAFWNQAQVFELEDAAQSKSAVSLSGVTLTKPQLRALSASQAQLTPAYVLVALFAPEGVAESAKRVTGLTNGLWTLLGGATQSQPASLGEFTNAKDQDQKALKLFLSASRKDLGAKPIAG